MVPWATDEIEPEERYYWRPESFLYPIHSHPTYQIFVGRSESGQTLFGPFQNHFLFLEFDLDGDFKSAETVEFPVPLSQRMRAGSSEWREVVEESVRNFRESRGLRDELIRVKRFRHPKYLISLDDLFHDEQMFMINPDSFSEKDQVYLAESVELWKEMDAFILWWGGCDKWIDMTGEVISS